MPLFTKTVNLKLVDELSMRTIILRTVKFSLGASVLVGILGNSGCLVDTGSDVTDPVGINQKHLRIYKPGNVIQYNVQIDVNQGTLVTRWDLPVGDEIVDGDPLQNGLQPIEGLLKETTTLDYEGSDGPVTVVRYITQDDDPSSPTYGSMTVHAFNAQSGPPNFDYVHDSLSLVGKPNPAVIIPSPLLDDNLQPISDQDFSIGFWVFPCDSAANRCSTVNQSLVDTLERSESIKETLETTVEFFDSLKVPFSTGSNGQVVDQNTNEPNVRLDIKAWCGDITDQTISFSGAQWFYPSIGIVRYEITCIGTAGQTNIQATVSDVNFSY